MKKAVEESNLGCFLVKFTMHGDLTMGYFTTRKSFLVPSFDIEAKEEGKMIRFLSVLEKSGIQNIISKSEYIDSQSGGRPAYNPYDLLATIIYGFAFDKCTVRDLEEACKFDLRYIFLMQQERPCYTTFSNFINDVILPNAALIFYKVTQAILKECDLTVINAYIDGTKFEADANRYKFVWKPTTFHEKLCDKIRVLLNSLNLQRGVPLSGIFDSKMIASKLTQLHNLLTENSAFTKSYTLLSQYLAKALEYEEKERICGFNRNSYYKTDHDATAMCLKNDYYAGLGSSLHAAYNSQIMVSSGFIVSYCISQSRTDISEFIPVLSRFFDYFGYYPQRICADAGYGSIQNYSFLDMHHIENFVKYFSWEGNLSGRNPDPYFLNDDETITCLNGYIGHEVVLDNRHPRKSNAVFYRIDGCNSCPFVSYCKRFMSDKSENFKIFEVIKQLYFYKQQAEENLLSPIGIEMRVNRSSQVENAFGVIKEDMGYERLRRTSIPKADCEIMLTYLGYNVRKLFRFFSGKTSFKYWSAPPDLQSESFKKPSAKRLSNRANKRKMKSVNEKNKRAYKYKSK